jgi:transcriptional regulator
MFQKIIPTGNNRQALKRKRLCMYIPKLNLMADRNEIVEFMERFSFATIITAKDNLPVATHLPFLVTVVQEKIVLTSHFAKANEQWKGLENGMVLVVFSEPHAYISPKHYDKELNVPTWNYLSVHAYGQGTIIYEPEKAMSVLDSTIDYFDLSYREQWKNLPNDYKYGLAKGIVAFQIIVNEIQAKKKLSQNKTENEQRKIINALSESNQTNEQLIAEYMEKKGRK